ncbi:methyltransferase domain-containing protein [Kitasatospora sp. NPDC057015]|uniref:methyltransferase domain-containing protein n=1 Tax=Kitasatospora sp. NPDC057015 TaxID=3346001 RepID=UPI0036453FCE
MTTDVTRTGGAGLPAARPAAGRSREDRSREGRSRERADFEEFEQAGWARRSGTYDDGFGRMTAGVHGLLLDAAEVRRGTRLLEVGCGTGRLARAALERGAEVVATDAVAQMVAQAAAALPQALVRQAALPRLPFADGGFEAVVGAFVVNHVPEPLAAVAELARVTAPGGRVVLSCWDTPAENLAQGLVAAAVAEAGATPAGDLPGHSPFAPYASTEAFAGLLEAAGLRDVRVESARWTHPVDPGRWWQDVLDGTVLTASLIEGQDRATVARIRAAYDRLTAPFTGPDGTAALPVAALVAVGTHRR